MELQLNEGKIREMAGRMRKAFGPDQVSHSKALEAVSQTLGFPNWDTLSGLLKREQVESQPMVVLTGPVRLYLDAFSVDEWADSPGWACVTVDQALVDALLEQRALCRTKDLTQVSLDWDSQTWGNSKELNIRGETLEVGKNSWWFSARPKHADDNVETRMMDIDDFLKALTSRTDTDFLQWRQGTLFYDGAGNVNGLLEQLVDEEQLDGSFLPEAS